MSLHNLAQLPGYTFDAAAAGIASLLGRDPLDTGGHPPLACQILLVLFLGLTAFRIGRQRGVSRGLAVALTLALAFWALSGLDRTPERYATSSRYQYPSAIFLLLIAAELLRGVRIPRLAIAAMAVVTAGAVFGGVSLLQRDYEHTWKPMADDVRLTLAAIDVAGGGVRPDFQLAFPPAPPVPAQTYLAAASAQGSPAFDEGELLARPEPERRTADVILVAALGIALDPPAPAERSPQCRAVSQRIADALVRLRPGRYSLANAGTAKAKLGLGRFADGFPAGLGSLPPGRTRALLIPADSSPRPWKLFAAGGSVRLC